MEKTKDEITERKIYKMYKAYILTKIYPEKMEEVFDMKYDDILNTFVENDLPLHKEFKNLCGAEKHDNDKIWQIFRSGLFFINKFPRHTHNLNTLKFHIWKAKEAMKKDKDARKWCERLNK